MKPHYKSRMNWLLLMAGLVPIFGILVHYAEILGLSEKAVPMLLIAETVVVALLAGLRVQDIKQFKARNDV